MKAKSLFLLFLLFSLILILLCLSLYTKPLYAHHLEVLRLSKIQKINMKEYSRKRNHHLHIASLQKAQREINHLLLKRPITFLDHSDQLDENSSTEQSVPNPNKVTLAEISNIVNYFKEEKLILRIATHTDKAGTQQENLKLSQARADRLKSYFKQKSPVALITSIGYGEQFPRFKADSNLSNKRVEIHLRRIQR